MQKLFPCIIAGNHVHMQELLLHIMQLKVIVSGDSRLTIQGGHDFKIMRPLHYKLNFLHLHTLKIGLKIHVCVLKILGLAMPMHMSTFYQDFPQLNF